jgi:uncharacterized membrane protein
MKNSNESGKIIRSTTMAIIVSFLRSIAKKKSKETPEIILERKFSSGEIDSHEYNRRKRQLQKDEDLKTKKFFLSTM